MELDFVLFSLLQGTDNPPPTIFNVTKFLSIENEKLTFGHDSIKIQFCPPVACLFLSFAALKI